MPRDTRKTKSTRKVPETGEKETPLNEGVKNFEEEVQTLGKRVEKKSEQYRGWYYDSFGVAGPLLSAVIAILLFSAGLWALNLFMRETGSTALRGIHDFLLSSLALFFLIFLASSYISYLRVRAPREYLAVSPLATAFGTTVFFWVAANVMAITSAAIGNIEGSAIADFIARHLFGIFWFFAIIGYFFLFIRLLLGRISEDMRYAGAEPTHASATASGAHAGGPKRLYRSGRDRILGGVCGGIAEYLGIDPVIVRFLWAISIVFYGTGLLLYLIAWIIIPRNPRDKWD